MPVWNSYRTIVLESAAQEAADLYSKEHHRFDDAWSGLEWFLSRKPGSGRSKILNNIEYFVYVQASDDFAKTPEIAVVYTFDTNEVVIYGVESKEYKASTEEEAE